MLCLTKDVKGIRRSRVCALVWVHQQRDFAVVPLDIFPCGIKCNSKLLKRVQLESPKNPIDLVVPVNLSDFAEKLLQGMLAFNTRLTPADKKLQVTGKFPPSGAVAPLLWKDL